MKIRFAITPSPAALDPSEFGAYLERVEALGFDTLWLSDLPIGPLGDPLLSLAFAASSTKRLKLGANIVPLGRSPLWLAKQLAHLDQLSNGRLLLSLVPGIGQPTERAALGYPSGDRGRAIEEMMTLLRRWWAGERVSGQFENLTFCEVALAPVPVQAPLEIWLGGKSVGALERAARCADGWLTAGIAPNEAAAGYRKIQDMAREAGRVVDPEHFGISIPYSRGAPRPEVLEAFQRRSGGQQLSDLLPIGDRELVRLVGAHAEAGLSKFVVRPLDQRTTDWRRDLEWLAELLLPLQT